MSVGYMLIPIWAAAPRKWKSTPITLSAPTVVMEQMFVARRNCPVCNREMLVHDSLAVKMPTEGTEQPSRQSAVPRIESSERMMLLILRGEGK
jgi:hypothetical protein